MTPKTLERRALQAHATGQTWNAFWAEHGDDARAAEPFNNGRLRKLEHRLHHLVTCGDGDFWCDGEPWLEDDRRHREARGGKLIEQGRR